MAPAYPHAGYGRLVRAILSTLAVALAVLSVPGPAAGSVAAPRARRAASERPEAPPGQAAREGYEVFFAPPTSTLGSFDELNLEYELSSGGAGAVGELRGPLERPVIVSALDRPAECHATEPTAVCGLVITSASVAAVSVNGGPAIPTVPAVTGPFGFRSILYEVQGVAISERQGDGRPQGGDSGSSTRPCSPRSAPSGTPITSTRPAEPCHTFRAACSKPANGWRRRPPRRVSVRWRRVPSAG